MPTNRPGIHGYDHTEKGPDPTPGMNNNTWALAENFGTVIPSTSGPGTTISLPFSSGRFLTAYPSTFGSITGPPNGFAINDFGTYEIYASMQLGGTSFGTAANAGLYIASSNGVYTSNFRFGSEEVRIPSTLNIGPFSMVTGGLFWPTPAADGIIRVQAFQSSGTARLANFALYVNRAGTATFDAITLGPF